MMKKPGCAPLAATIVLSACASGSKDIATSYASPIAYQGYSCAQVVAENDRIGRRVSELGGRIDSRAEGDAVAMGVGLVLFWPALFFLKGDGPEATEYARLKGEHEALQKASVEKGCGLSAAPAVNTSQPAANLQPAVAVVK